MRTWKPNLSTTSRPPYMPAPSHQPVLAVSSPHHISALSSLSSLSSSLSSLSSPHISPHLASLQAPTHAWKLAAATGSPAAPPQGSSAGTSAREASHSWILRSVHQDSSFVKAAVRVASQKASSHSWRGLGLGLLLGLGLA